MATPHKLRHTIATLNVFPTSKVSTTWVSTQSGLVIWSVGYFCRLLLLCDL